MHPYDRYKNPGKGDRIGGVLVVLALIILIVIIFWKIFQTTL
jgi:hypothetical protein